MSWVVLVVVLVVASLASLAVVARHRALGRLAAARGRLLTRPLELPAPREREVELDWLHHQHPEVGVARIIRDRRRPDGLIARSTVVDGPIDPSRPSRVIRSIGVVTRSVVGWFSAVRKALEITGRFAMIP